MKYEPWFDTTENRALLALTTWRFIRLASLTVGAVALLNIALFAAYMEDSLFVVAHVICCALVAPACVWPAVKPAIRSYSPLAFAVVPSGLSGTAVVLASFGELDLGGAEDFSIMLAILTVVFAFTTPLSRIYAGRFSALVASVQPEQMDVLKASCKEIRKQKAKEDASFVEADSSGGVFRIKLMEDRAFATDPYSFRVFVIPKTAVPDLIKDLGKAKLKMTVRHPLVKLVLSFDKDNSEKLKDWLAAEPEASEATTVAEGSPDA